VIMINNSEN